MSYLSLSDKDKKEMLARTGVGAVDDLFCCIPGAVRLKRPLDLPHAQSELELIRTIDAIGAKNAASGQLVFLGGGAYEHFIPTVVDYLSSRGEFVSRTPPTSRRSARGHSRSSSSSRPLSASSPGSISPTPLSTTAPPERPRPC
jgi:glycine cleavage system P protein (glycine dehydrogenase) subunit 1